MLLLSQLAIAYLVVEYLLPLVQVPKPSTPTIRVLKNLVIRTAVATAAINVQLERRLLIIIVVLALAQIAIDSARARLGDSPRGFVFLEICHASAIGVAWVVAREIAVAPALVRDLNAGTTKLYLVIAAYLLVVFWGGEVVRRITQSFLRKMDEGLAEKRPGLPQAGLYIGWLERFLILTFVLASFGDAVGFLLAAKALVRLPEIQEDKKGYFAEYFLVGTLTSVGLALFVGSLVVRALDADS